MESRDALELSESRWSLTLPRSCQLPWLRCRLPDGSRSVVFRLAHTRAFLIGHVTLGLLDRAFEFRREFQFVLDQIIKPATDLTKLCL